MRLIESHLHTAHQMEYAVELNNRAVVELNSGKLEMAQKYLARSVCILRSLPEMKSIDQTRYSAVSIEESSKIHNSIGVFQRQDYDEGMNVFYQAVSLTNAEDNGLFDSLAIALMNQGICYGQQRRERQAYSIFHQALALWQRSNHGCEGSIMTLHNIGRLEYRSGLFNEAISTYEKALKLSEKNSMEGRQYLSVRAATLNCLSVVYFHFPKVNTLKALSFCQSALAAYKSFQGNLTMSTEVASILNNIGRLYFIRDELEMAIPVYTEALLMRRQLLGDRHMDVAATLFNLAQTSHALSRYDQALAFYDEFISIAQSILGEKHRDIVAALKVR